MGFRLILFFLVSNILFAQNEICGTTFYVNQSLQESPEKKIILEQLNNFTKDFIELNKNCRTADTNYVIPVVVHIIHNYGPERISELQVESAIETMNNDFNALNNDITGVINEFTALISDIGIEFRLARLDENGNCTNGITYNQSVLTYSGGENVKDDTYWNNDMYMNIWVVADLASEGTAAYAYYPGTAPDNHEGIICDDDYFGTMGTASNSNWSRHTMPHEVGHYFNLPHPWGSNNGPGDEDNDGDGVPDNCLIDDGVEDTPLTFGVGNSNCPLNQSSCDGSLDNVQNIMDYSNCALMFTEGQKARVHAALNSNAGGRKYLWQEDNLWSTGAHNDYNSELCTPIADFKSNTQSGCNNTTVFFEDMSYNTTEIGSYYWYFGDSADPVESTLKNPVVTYNQPGSHTVRLVVSNSGGSNELIKEEYITILDNDVAPYLEQFESSNFPNNIDASNWYIKPNGEELTWLRNQIASYDGQASIRISSQYFNYNDIIHELTTPELDFTNQFSESGNPLALYFNLAYARRLPYTVEGESIISDKLDVLISKDCGETWIQRASFEVDELNTKGDSIVFNTYVPEAADWEERYVNIQNAANEPSVIIKFQFSGPAKLNEEEAIVVDNGTIITDNVGGNWLYIDNIRIGNGEWETLENNIKEIDFDIFPNPASQSSYLRFNLEKDQDLQINIYNLLGEKVFYKEKMFKRGNNTLLLFDFLKNNTSGLYFVELLSKNYYGKDIIILSK